ncbi:MAG: ureidoglycolate lyase [Salaquimonas sp.]
MPDTIIARPLTKADFAPYGDVLEKPGSEEKVINNGNCVRHHDLATIDFVGDGAKTSINIFCGQPYATPLKLELVERHPLGSQAFLPMHDRPFLVVVCTDENGTPGKPEAFITSPGQGINFRRNQWHGVLTPLYEQGDFVVVDRIGEGNNLEEYTFETPFIISLP